MTFQHYNATSHIARSVRDFLQGRNVSVLPWPAKSPDLRLGPVTPPERFRNLQMPWWKSGVTSHSRNWKTGAVHEEEMHCSTYCSWWPHQILTVTFDFDPLFVQGHIIPFLLFTCLWNLFILCLSCWILFTHVKFVENKRSWQWEDWVYVSLWVTWQVVLNKHPLRVIIIPLACVCCSVCLGFTLWMSVLCIPGSFLGTRLCVCVCFLVCVLIMILFTTGMCLKLVYMIWYTTIWYDTICWGKLKSC